jgi:alginate O-acetyltransferase complex protein AlgI
MLFNSFEFLVFLPVVFLLYWFIVPKNVNRQNILLLLASYFFYGWWDWRFLFLLALSTLLDYKFGSLIYAAVKHKKLFLWFSIIMNLGILAIFKYYNFFAGNFQAALGQSGWKVEPYFLDIILPIGISFYIFHGLSYVFDIYRGKIVPEKSFINYAVFVSFFPLLVAGPIERATHLLPQVIQPRKFNYLQATDGLRLILWGFFKKVIIADSLAPIVSNIFANYSDFSGSVLLLGVIYFALQIYCDFSGYSDIAIGTAKLFGIELLTNFKFPYFSRDIADFWRRWHISLTSWFRDYLYIPLGGSKYGKWLSLRNIFIIFFVSGFWHGANWTFIAWGGVHALMYIPLFLTNKNRKNVAGLPGGDRSFPRGKELVNILLTFLVVCVAWIFFRSPTIEDAFGYFGRMISLDFFSIPASNRLGVFYVMIVLALDWICRKDERVPFFIYIKNQPLRIFVYLIVILMVTNKLFNSYGQEFIYFKF